MCSWDQVRDHIDHSMNVCGKNSHYMSWQSSDPDFAQLLNRVWEGRQTNNDVIQIKALAKNDTATLTIT